MITQCQQTAERGPQGLPPFAGIKADEPRYVPDDAYNIQHDPDAAAKVAKLLLDGYVERRGEPVHIGRALGTNDVWAIHVFVDALRRVGHVIDGKRGVAGYTYRGFDPPPAWLHKDNVLRDVVREQLRADEAEVIQGQMELEDGA